MKIKTKFPERRAHEKKSRVRMEISSGVIHKRQSRWDLRRWGRWWVGLIGFYIVHGRDSRFHPVLGSHWRVEGGQRHESANL